MNHRQAEQTVQTVRRRILEILKRRKSATVGELARQLEMAPVSVRYHLDILQGDNLIQVSKVRREGNVGRPKQLYSLTKEANDVFPDNFAPLTAGLVAQLKKSLPPEQVEAAFCSLARDMAETFLEEDDLEEADLEVRLDQVTDFLNERGYLARWEKETHAEWQSPAQGDSYLLHTFNCPYAGVSSEHRELCHMDLSLMRDLVGRTCCRLDSLAEDGHCCTYRIQTGETAQERPVPAVEIPLIG
ncbi:MAG: helix-turn-helix domain-containing protein [Caldilineaceae bacterium]|nr:helix-turn-helix domain-containing protein [Caldilineaceae bacterium]